MKRYALTILAAFLSVLLQAQIHPMGGNSYEVVGRNLLTNRDIVAYKEPFQEKVYHVRFDTVTNIALVHLWNPDGRDSRSHASYNCEIAYYDLVDHEVKWTKSINLLDDELSKIGRYLCYEEGNTLFILDPSTGMERFKVGKRIRPFFSNSTEGWLICSTQRLLVWGTKNFRKIDLNTNEALWHRSLNVKADLKVLAKTNDSTLVFVGEGIHTVDINDGTGWDYGLKTEEYDESHPIQVRSRPLVDSTSIYMAGVKYLVKLDHQGLLKWRTELPSDKTSHSLIGLHDDCVVILNQGYAECSISPYSTLGRKWGKPFLASFDANTGEMRYMHERQYLADYALDAIIRDNVIYILYADRDKHQSVERYDVDRGNLQRKKDISQVTLDKVGTVTGFVGLEYYTMVDSVLKPLCEMDTLGVYLEADKGIVHIDASLLQSDIIDFENLYIYMGRHGDLRFFSYHHKVLAFDSDYREVATLDFHDIYCTESEIYSIKDNTLYIINRDQIRME